MLLNESTNDRLLHDALIEILNECFYDIFVVVLKKFVVKNFDHLFVVFKNVTFDCRNRLN